jgi:hypothetical protein
MFSTQQLVNEESSAGLHFPAGQTFHTAKIATYRVLMLQIQCSVFTIGLRITGLIASGRVVPILQASRNDHSESVAKKAFSKSRPSSYDGFTRSKLCQDREFIYISLVLRLLANFVELYVSIEGDTL